MRLEKSIIEIKSKLPGKKIALIGGIHGNEPTGIAILKEYEHFVPRSGTLILIYGNPKAIENKKRFFETDLNRSFLNTNGKTYEYKRAREIRKVLKTCDAVLDIHSYAECWEAKKSFLICEKPSVEVATHLGVELITTGWKNFDKGSTDHLMFLQNKVGICLECGPNSALEKNMRITKKVVDNFLGYYGLLDKKVKKYKTRVIHLKTPPFDEKEKFLLK